MDTMDCLLRMRETLAIEIRLDLIKTLTNFVSILQ